jgi:Mg/Co/Ni transporter MgtE
VREVLIRELPEGRRAVAVLDADGRPLGVATLRNLDGVAPGTLVGDVFGVDPGPVGVRAERRVADMAGGAQQRVGWPQVVVDDDGRFVGLAWDGPSAADGGPSAVSRFA